MTLPSTPERVAQLSSIRPSLVRDAAIGGLLGGLVLFFIMAGYNAANQVGFWGILNTCFAAFVFNSARMSPMHEMGMHGHAMGMGMGGQSIVASHLIVGGLLHVAMSVGAGIAFTVALAMLIRAGFQPLASPVIYVLGGAAGGALLYLIMMEGIAPSLNRTIVDFTPRAPFFLAHLAYGATVAAWVYWRTAAGEKQVVIHKGTRYAPA